MAKKKPSKKDTSNKKNRPQNGVQKTNNSPQDRKKVKETPSLEKSKEPAAEGKDKKEGFNAVKFFQESKEELSKVVWPSRQQLISESAAVVLMVTLVATTIYFVDNLFLWLSGKVF